MYIKAGKGTLKKDRYVKKTLLLLLLLETLFLPICYKLSHMKDQMNRGFGCRLGSSVDRESTI